MVFDSTKQRPGDANTPPEMRILPGNKLGSSYY